MPAEKDAPDRADFAPRAAMMVTHGFASFNRGLRAYLFGLAALAWFIQPWALVLASTWVVAVLYWRDSRSATLATLAGPVTGKELPLAGDGRACLAARSGLKRPVALCQLLLIVRQISRLLITPLFPCACRLA